MAIFLTAGLKTANQCRRNRRQMMGDLTERIAELEAESEANAEHARLANANHKAIARSLKAATMRIAKLEAALSRLSSPLAFTSGHVASHEETARMKFAEEALAALEEQT